MSLSTNSNNYSEHLFPGASMQHTLLTLHPVLQGAGLYLFLHALYLGMQRFGQQHLGRKIVFRWQHHVIIGSLSLFLLASGALLGLLVSRYQWQAIFVTGRHGYAVLLLFPFIIVTLGSGLYLHLHKKHSRILPLLHGINNAVLFFLLLYQTVTGWQVYQSLVLGN